MRPRKAKWQYAKLFGYLVVELELEVSLIPKPTLLPLHDLREKLEHNKSQTVNTITRRFHSSRKSLGQPGSGCDPGDLGSSPMSGSLQGACFSLCLCLCLSLMNNWIKSFLKIKSSYLKKKKHNSLNIVIVLFFCVFPLKVFLFIILLPIPLLLLIITLKIYQILSSTLKAEQFLIYLG